MITKYKIGEKVKVVANRSSHHFDIGEIVIVKSFDPNGTLASCWKLNKTDWWGISDQEIAKLTITVRLP